MAITLPTRSSVLIATFFVSTAMGQVTLKNMSLKPEEARKCALEGDADCQAGLGMFYENGSDGVREDHAEAIRWYRKAAEQGLVITQVVLAKIYEGGYHVPQDYAEAAKWYLMAAERGDLNSQETIALFYWSGKGIPANRVRAHMWANLAVVGEQSYSEDRVSALNAINAGPGTPEEKGLAIQILSIKRPERSSFAEMVFGMRKSIEASMTPAQIAEAQRLAREWKPTKAK